MTWNVKLQAALRDNLGIGGGDRSPRIFRDNAGNLNNTINYVDISLIEMRQYILGIPYRLVYISNHDIPPEIY